VSLAKIKNSKIVKSLDLGFLLNPDPNTEPVFFHKNVLNFKLTGIPMKKS
jgi:hypothetical protein